MSKWGHHCSHFASFHSHPSSDKPDVSHKKQKPPMLRARTLPAIIPPALNILQAQWRNSATPGDSRKYSLSERHTHSVFKSSVFLLSNAVVGRARAYYLQYNYCPNQSSAACQIALIVK